MIDADNVNDAKGNILCKACGLCCTGHLFIWVRLRSSELDRSQALGLNVIRNDPRQRGFTQPCPLWAGACTVYASPHYPRQCRSYQCKLLKEVLVENAPLPQGLAVVERAKRTIQELEILLPKSTTINFRERLANHMEHGNMDPEFQAKANSLLLFLKENFGVKDFLD